MLERIDQELKDKTKTNFRAVEPKEDWTIKTQKPLRPFGPHRSGDEWWINRIPDIAVGHQDRHEILVEVKIDAGLTYRDDISQTKAYRKYLKRRRELGVQTALVALTRWRNSELENDVDVRFSFKELAELLEESSTQAAPNKGTVVELARRWAKFIRSEEWVMPDITEGQSLDDIEPFGRLGCGGDELQILNELPNRSAKLVAEQQAGKLAAPALPLFGQCQEADVLCENQAAHRGRSLQQLVIGQAIRRVFDGSQHVDLAPAQLVGNRLRHVNVHVQCDRHQSSPLARIRR